MELFMSLRDGPYGCEFDGLGPDGTCICVNEFYN